ncbi:hypothetical protein ALC56_02423 [Trachymyrmex septentrionalis]|uniref:Uncharacterized protein n=1 Tax=Trachymyrmex septentrionalis TaxID=34720 RepID=A0A151K0A6_9HYME|nr:hypothetical protein ALC56_02423 [Trachymyrmex septentrionalis]
MKFVRQSQMIKMTNVDNKQTEKEIRKHGNMLPISIRGIICGPSNCGKTNVLISLLESLYGFENMYVYSQSLQQPKYRYLKILLAPIEKIGYFTFSNNNDVVPPKRDASKFHFCLR